MGMTSARRAWAILDNVERAIAIELLCAAQGLDLRSPLEPARGTGAALAKVREVSEHLTEDRSLAPDVDKVRDLIRAGAFENLSS